MQVFLKKYWTELLCGFGFLITRLMFLTRLPVFNDEAIYIDWGWRMVHWPNMAFYSLYDGKQPLLMWIFGSVQSVFADPVLASRLVSVAFGLLSFIGIYLITLKIHNRAAALLAACLYGVIPLFVFFDRQALMESAVAAVGVWMFYVYLRFDDKPHYFSAALLGLFLGLGFFIKSSATLFAVSLLAVSVVNGVKKPKLERREYWFLIGISLLLSQLVLIPLYAQDRFWSSLSMNSRFSLSLAEVAGLPLQTWLMNIYALFDISFWQLSPPIALALVVSFYQLWRTGVAPEQKSLLLWLSTLMGIFIVFTRSASPRYVVALLPLFVVVIAGAVSTLTARHRRFVGLLLLVIPGMCTLFFITNPGAYLLSLQKVTRHSQADTYLTLWTAGGAAEQALSSLKNRIGRTPALVAVRADAGNPENTVFFRFHRLRNVRVMYLDQNDTPGLVDFDCVESNVPMYFVARDSHMAGTERFWTESERYWNEGGQTSVGVYQLKPCAESDRRLRIDK